MNLVALTPDFELTSFDCGDGDLNEFLLNDAKKAIELRIANTFLVEDNGRIVAYFCLLNDRISRNEITNSQWKKIKSSFPVNRAFCCCIRLSRAKYRQYSDVESQGFIEYGAKPFSIPLHYS